MIVGNKTTSKFLALKIHDLVILVVTLRTFPSRGANLRLLSRRERLCFVNLFVFLIAAKKNCSRSTDTGYDYIGFGYSYLHSAEYSSRINSTLSANVGIFARSDEYRLPRFVHIGNYTRGSSFFWLFFRIANSVRLDYDIFVLVLATIELTKVRNQIIFIHSFRLSLSQNYTYA